VTLQQEVLPRVSVEVGYQRRWLVNSLVTDNRARAAADHDRFSVAVPADSRLPGSGGGMLDNFYNVTPTAATRLNDNYQTLAHTYAAFPQVANSVNMNVTARTRNGLVLQGGLNTGVSSTDSCAVRELLPEIAATNPWCDTSSGWVTRLTALGSYTVPKVDVQIAGTFRSDQGTQLAANYAVASTGTTLGRSFAGLGSQTITVNLVEPGTLYGDRVNQVDMRFAKLLRFRGTRANVGIDVYNIANSATPLTYNQTFIVPDPVNPASKWLRPTNVLHPRYVKFSAQIDF
jgi:hypothetical protein